MSAAASPSAPAAAGLAVDGLRVGYAADGRMKEVVRGVTLALRPGETLGIVGESGCGKSATALALAALLPPNGAILGGSVALDGHDLVACDERELRDVRGRRIGVVFQESLAALNPLLSIGRQVCECLERHRGLDRAAARAEAARLLCEVGIADPDRRLGQFPHQLSGGLRQRVAIAIALAADPEILIADEPTTALDVTIQAQLLELLAREKAERNMALVLITHDLGVVASCADRVAVMYAGRIVETGPVEAVFAAPRHPYTAGLLRSVPRMDGDPEAELPAIPGQPPDVGALTGGCPFRSRCDRAVARCAAEEPPSPGPAVRHGAACWVTDPEGGAA